MKNIDLVSLARGYIMILNISSESLMSVPSCQVQPALLMKTATFCGKKRSLKNRTLTLTAPGARNFNEKRRKKRT